MNHKLNTHCGDTFDKVAEKAKAIAAEKQVTVEFDFNGVICLVNADTNLEHLYRDYSNSWTMEWKTVGPDCVESYASELQEEFERREKIKEAESKKRQDEYAEKAKREKEAFQLEVEGIELELSDADGWKKSREINSDGYGGAALDYAEGWAKLMQKEISNGKTVAECYEPTQKGLGFLGVTGFQFGCAVSILSQTWKHGDELRKAHNKEYGVSEDVKGTVNPAVMTLG